MAVVDQDLGDLYRFSYVAEVSGKQATLVDFANTAVYAHFGSCGGHVRRGGKLDLGGERRLAACAVSAMSCTWC
jgi:hypothetical protein